MNNNYDTDLYAWANEQASLLRAGRLADADIANIAEEIESVGRAERRELINRLAALLTHLLKWHAQPTYRGRSWLLTIKEQRTRLRRHLEENPSLGARLPDAVAEAYETALIAAQRETGFGEDAFPQHNPWSLESILAENFLP